MHVDELRMIVAEHGQRIRGVMESNPGFSSDGKGTIWGVQQRGDDRVTLTLQLGRNASLSTITKVVESGVGETRRYSRVDLDMREGERGRRTVPVVAMDGTFKPQETVTKTISLGALPSGQAGVRTVLEQTLGLFTNPVWRRVIGVQYAGSGSAVEANFAFHARTVSGDDVSRKRRYSLHSGGAIDEQLLEGQWETEDVVLENNIEWPEGVVLAGDEIVGADGFKIRGEVVIDSDGSSRRATGFPGRVLPGRVMVDDVLTALFQPVVPGKQNEGRDLVRSRDRSRELFGFSIDRT